MYKNCHYYRIGDFNICITDNLLVANDTMCHTFAGFEIDKPKYIDININCVEKLPNNTAQKLLFGNSDCMYPTYLFLNEDGNYQLDFYYNHDHQKISFMIDNDWKNISIYSMNLADDQYVIFSRIGAILNLAFLYHGACVFHGVVMDFQSKGILVMASSGVGKSTHTNMWEEKEHALILNGDRCLCRCMDGIWYAYGMPWAGSSNKIINMRTKISDIVMLERDSYNHVEELSDYYAEIKLLERIFASVAFDNLQDKAFDYVHDIASKVHIRRLCCRPDYESVDVLKAAIMKEDKNDRK